MKAHFIKHWNLFIPNVTITQTCRFVKEETSTDGSKQSIGEGWSLIVVGHPSLENGRDIPHSQILGWHRGTACNEVWRGGCPDGEMTWGGTRQTNRHTDRWMGRGWRYTTRINKNKVLNTKKEYNDIHYTHRLELWTFIWLNWCSEHNIGKSYQLFSHFTLCGKDSTDFLSNGEVN